MTLNQDATLVAFGITVLVAVFTAALAILTDLVRACKLNGPVLRALRWIWVSGITIVVIALLALLERLTDFYPTADFYTLAGLWAGFPLAAFFLALVRFWLALHASIDKGVSPEG